jgi:hypothetical protein
MINFPSHRASIIFGAIGMPFFMYIANNVIGYENQIFIILWSLFGFIIPVAYSTLEKEHIEQIKQILNIKYLRLIFYERQDNSQTKKFFIPAWKRFFTLLLSMLISILALNFLGISLS